MGAGLLGRDSESRREPSGTEGVHVCGPIGGRINICEMRFLAHTFKVRHPGAAISIRRDECPASSFSLPAVHAPELQKQDRPEKYGDLLVIG